MNNEVYTQIKSFIWNIANDVLVHAFQKGDYKKVILPMMVLRRLDLLLEPTKQQVLDRKVILDRQNMPAESQDRILCRVAGYAFCNVSLFTMKSLKSESNSTRLLQNFNAYLDGFSKDVQDIIAKFKLKYMAQQLNNQNRLGMIIEKFTDESINLGINPILNPDGTEKLPGLDNHSMGTMFEELLRRFNEENSVTEAGEHFTPRDYVKLLADIAIMPVANQLKSGTYEVYDGACGTGGILSISADIIKQIGEQKNKQINVHIYGQELEPETYATCKADLMLAAQQKSFTYDYEGEKRPTFANGSTISADGHKGKRFDFCISNPPFGTSWKPDLIAWGLAENEKNKITDRRFVISGDNGEVISFVPGTGDPQMLFLANNLSRIKDDTEFGTRIVEIHNGSSLFTGNAGGGESNLRRYIIEHDMLEAVIAMPLNDFYNTGIGTYIWVLTNRKEPRRKGKVQLIDATDIKTPLRKNLGNKNCETNEDDRAAIVKLLTDFTESEQCKIFPNGEFGYWEITVDRPLRQVINIDNETLAKCVKSLQRKNVDFSSDCVELLAEKGIVVVPDTTPVLEEGESIFDEKYKDVRSIKLPKTIGQLRADDILSITFIALCELSKEKTTWNSISEFEKAFNSNSHIKHAALNFSKVEDALLYIKRIDANGEPVMKKGKFVPDKDLRDTEQVPLLYEGGIEAFMTNEVLPYAPDAYVNESDTKVGYELSFTKYFYKPEKLESIENLTKEIREIESRTDGLLNEILMR